MFDKTIPTIKKKLSYFALLNRVASERDVSKKEAAEIIRKEGLMGAEKEKEAETADKPKKEPKSSFVSEIETLEELAEINPYHEVYEKRKQGEDSADCLWHMCGRYHELAIKVKAKLVKENALLKRDNELLEAKIKPGTAEIRAKIKELEAMLDA